jgi:hypothetical protein
MSNQHEYHVIESPDGSAFAHCDCGWIGPGHKDMPTLFDDDPPVALDGALHDGYNHLSSMRRIADFFAEGAGE